MRKYIILTLALTVTFAFLLFGCAPADPEAWDYFDGDAEVVEEEPEAEEDFIEEEDELEEVEVEDEVEDEIREEEFPVEAAGIHGLISRIEYGDNVAYIFGSMHYGRPHWYPLHPAVENAMRSADVFAFETDITPEGQALAAPAMLEYMMLDNMSLSEFLEEDVFIEMMMAVESYGVSYQAIRNFTPWVVNVFLTDIAYDRVGITSDYGIDFYVLDFARLHNLPILYLNSIEHELDLAFNLTDEMQRYAALSIERMEDAVEYVEMMVLAYETQDIEQLTAMTRESFLTGEALNPLEEYLIDVIIIQRSVEFAGEIIRLLEETQEPTTFFVTMGIGHMIGDDHGNVFNYLQDAGFEVTPLYR
jgi:uncharacterized protein YbaP (TraB family)